MQIRLYDLRNRRPSVKGVVALLASPMLPLADGTYAIEAANEAHAHAQRTATYFRTVLGIHTFDGQGRGPHIYIRARGPTALTALSVEVRNTWDVLLFGEGDRKRYSRPTKSEDIVAHEMVHAYLRHQSAAEYLAKTDGAAIIEHTCDIVGVLIRRQSDTSARWTVGSQITLKKRALRDLETPDSGDLTYRCVGHMNNRRPYRTIRDLYANAGVLSRAIVLAVQALGPDSEQLLGAACFNAARALPRQPSFELYREEVLGQFLPGSTEHLATEGAFRAVGL